MHFPMFWEFMLEKKCNYFGPARTAKKKAPIIIKERTNPIIASNFPFNSGLFIHTLKEIKFKIRNIKKSIKIINGENGKTFIL